MQISRVFWNNPVKWVYSFKLTRLVGVIPKHFHHGMARHQHVINPRQRLFLEIRFLFDVVIEPALHRRS